MQHKMPCRWLSWRLALLACSLLSVTGCMTTSIKSEKDEGYSKRIASVAILNEGGALSEQYPTLVDRMERITESLRSSFVANDAKVAVLSTRQLELNKAEKLRNFLRETNAEHLLRLNVLRASKRDASIAVEFYAFEATLVDLNTGKEAWKSMVQANFYSEPDAMVKELINILVRDGLLKRKVAVR